MNDKPYKLQQFISCLWTSLTILPYKSVYLYIRQRSHSLFWVTDIICLPLLFSGFLGFTPLTNMGVKHFGNFVPFNFFYSTAASTCLSFKTMLLSGFWQVSLQKRQSKLILHLHLWLKHRSSNWTPFPILNQYEGLNSHVIFGLISFV